MENLDLRLRFFGLDPDWVRESLRAGRMHAVLDALERAKEALELQRAELDDLEDALRAMVEGKLADTGRLSDDELELLNAAGHRMRID